MITFDKCGDCGSTIHQGRVWWPIPRMGALCPSCEESWVRQQEITLKEYEMVNTLISVPRHRGTTLVSDHIS